MSVIARCEALSADGAFCEADFDLGSGTPGETRLCSDGLHRWRWTGQAWTNDLSYQPPTACYAA